MYVVCLPMFVCDMCECIPSFIHLFIYSRAPPPWTVMFLAMGNIEKVPALTKLTFYMKRNKNK